MISTYQIMCIKPTLCIKIWKNYLEGISKSVKFYITSLKVHPQDEAVGPL